MPELLEENSKTDRAERLHIGQSLKRVGRGKPL